MSIPIDKELSQWPKDLSINDSSLDLSNGEGWNSL